MYYKKANDRRWKSPARVLGQDGKQVLVKHGSHYIHVHPCRLTLERTPITIQNKNKSTQETQEHQQQYNRERQNTAYDSDSEEETQQNSPTDKSLPYQTEDDMRDLNALVERLSVTDQPLTGNTSDTDHILDRKAKLRKGMKVKFTLGNSKELKSATLISKSGKATGKYKNGWNSQLDDRTVTPIDFDQDISSLEIIPDSNSNIEEIHYSQIYITELEKQVFKTKTKELNS